MGATAPHADPGTPDIRGPLRYLWWLVTSQPARVCRGALWGSLWMVSLMLPPYLVARAIDDGLRQRDLAALTAWAAAVLGAGVLSAALGILRHRTMTRIRMDAALRTVQVITRHATRLGARLPASVTTGEVVTVNSADVTRIAAALTVTGPGVGGVVAYVAVAVLLWTVSPLLATVLGLGVPVLGVIVGPLVRRLLRVEGGYRRLEGELTGRAGDIVAGLRVLCGIGGKSRFATRYRSGSAALRAEGYRVGAVTTWIQALSVGLPAVFLAVVVWLAARMAAAGQITVGEMVAVYGYVAVLVGPVLFFIEGADEVSRAIVSARRVIRILALRPTAERPDPAPAPDAPAALRDPASGLVVPAGRMVAVAAERPSEADAIVDRLGHYVESDARWGETPLTRLALADVRRRIVVADHDAYLFAGTVRDVVTTPITQTARTTQATRSVQDGAAIAAAVRVAAAEDVIAGVPSGLDGPVQDQARDLSGGQAQRLRLVRALLTDPEVLLLVEPTSALDAHTEATIAGRLRPARAGRTTVVVCTSPLLLDRADLVAYVRDGRVAATGSHTELLAGDPDYRALVLRESGEDA